MEYICRLIDSLIDDCTNFWGEDASNLGVEGAVLRARIQARMHNINGVQNDIFMGHKLLLKNTKDEWKELHRSATGGKFDDDDRVANSARLAAILQIGWQLRRGVRSRRMSMKRSLLAGP